VHEHAGLTNVQTIVLPSTTPGHQAALNALLEAEVSVVRRSFDFSDPTDEAAAGRRAVFVLFLNQYQELIARSTRNEEAASAEYQEDPVADIYVPLYDDFHWNGRTLVGLLTSVVYWQSYFVDILPDNARHIIVVLENTCDQAYTYQVNGPEVEYLGPGDLHETKFDGMEFATEPGTFLPVNSELRKMDGSCFYSIKIYQPRNWNLSLLPTNQRLTRQFWCWSSCSRQRFLLYMIVW
jgi:hypothetical protein